MISCPVICMDVSDSVRMHKRRCGGQGCEPDLQVRNEFMYMDLKKKKMELSCQLILGSVAGRKFAIISISFCNPYCKAESKLFDLEYISAEKILKPDH
ncbi:hypothetical protein QVD17_20444 [Tagetes erecta]|uniref:Uncharacterized protein n=1 Tax=Tagetes erecta TaxID=13708 RepID=A0AAD8NR08_TARER|nr:hypothetical protein QVD17_20444 [Tagetes erecta]